LRGAGNFSLKSAGDFDTIAHPCRIGGADFFQFSRLSARGVQDGSKGCADSAEWGVRPILPFGSVQICDLNTVYQGYDPSKTYVASFL